MSERKLTVMEARAKAMCAVLNREGEGTFTIEWRSGDGGRNPALLRDGKKCAHITGCGFEKESCALVDALVFLLPEGSEGRIKLAQAGGTGFESVRKILNNAGWILNLTQCGKTTDSYLLRRKEQPQTDQTRG